MRPIKLTLAVPDGGKFSGKVVLIPVEFGPSWQLIDVVHRILRMIRG